MDIVQFIPKNGVLVTDDDRAFNAEQEAALIKSTEDTLVPKFRYNCQIAYDKTEKWKILTSENSNDIYDYIDSVKGRITSKDDDFEKVMKEEGLTDLLGKVRIMRINFEIKTITNGKNCDPCVCQ